MRQKRLVTLVGSIFLVLVLATLSPMVACAKPTPGPTPIKVGVMGPLSGAKASWGLTFKRCTEMWADAINAEGGLLVDGVRHPIEVYVEDTRYDAALTKTAAERLVYEHKVRYIMGPATTMETQILQPIAEPEKVVFFTGSFNLQMYGSEHPYTVQVVPPPPAFGPVVYNYLMETKGAKTLYCLAINDTTGHFVQDMDIEIAQNLGLEVVVPDADFEPETTDFYPIMSKVVAVNPDIVSMEGCGAEHVALAAKHGGELGFKGTIVSQQAADIETVVSVAGEYAEGVMWMGGKPNPTPLMNEFIDDYTAKYGVWNDEAALKIVGAYMIGLTIQEAGEAALTDNDAWVAAMPKVTWPHPYIEGNPTVKYVGKWLHGRACMVGVPVCVTEVQNGKDVTVKCTIPE